MTEAEQAKGATASRPVVLPEPFSGESGWREWEYHFNNIAVVNNWTEHDKLLSNGDVNYAQGNFTTCLDFIKYKNERK